MWAYSSGSFVRHDSQREAFGRIVLYAMNRKERTTKSIRLMILFNVHQ